MSRRALQRSPVLLEREWTLKRLSPKQHAPLLDHAVRPDVFELRVNRQSLDPIAFD